MHPDVSQEQAYFDNALEQRERARAQLDRAPDMSTDPTAAAELRARLGSIGLADPDEGVAFGRIDRNAERLYIGKNAIWDESNDLLVVNWQAPAASAYYTATPTDSQGLDARRTYRCESNRVIDIDEIVFQRLADAVATLKGGDAGPTMGDALLESLGRNRSGELGDIVATIQAAQYDVVSRPIEQLLVVQGGPGTGKTVVGLHRASWLLYNLSNRLQSEDVLVVGPNPAFVRYIRAVLPRLGDEAVVQKSVTELGPRVRSGRAEPPVIRRLKGDRRMIELVVRGLRNRQRVGAEAGRVELTIDNRRVTLDPEMVAARASQLERRPHNEAHKGLRDFVIQEVQSYLGRRGVFDSSSLEAITRGASARDIDNYLDRVWPNLTPQAFLLDLLSTRSRLEAAAEGILDEHEVTLLSVPRDAKVGSYEWSIDDIPLLDAADFLLNGPQRMYEYIVLDEAQDLSPMQLLSIARRSRNGWMTVLGDLAQATSPAALGSWNEVADHLYRPDVPANLAELRLGYRLPTEVHEVALRLLREIAPGLATPTAVRPSGNEVMVERAEPGELAPAIVARIRSLLGTGLIGVITAEGIRDEVTAALDEEGLFWAPELQAATAPIVVLSAERAKGLEFDNVVVVEPAGIIADHGDNGMRALFVALTRCTQRLAIVHAEPLPAVLGLQSHPAGEPPEQATGALGDTGTDDADMARELVFVSASRAEGPGNEATPAAAHGPSQGEPAPWPGVTAGTQTTSLTGSGNTPGAGAGNADPADPAVTTTAAGTTGRAPAGPGATGPGTGTNAAGAAIGATGPDATGGPRPAAGPDPAGGAAPPPRPDPSLGVTTAPIGTASRSYRSGGRQSGSDLEQQVAATVTSAIATSLATTLRRLVQPALLPDIVEELGRLVAEPVDGGAMTGGTGGAGTAAGGAGTGVTSGGGTGGTGGAGAGGTGTGGTGGSVAVELPADLVARASQAVAAGQASDVSSFIASALEDRGKLAAVSGYVHQMLAEADGALSAQNRPQPPSP